MDGKSEEFKGLRNQLAEFLKTRPAQDAEFLRILQDTGRPQTIQKYDTPEKLVDFLLVKVDEMRQSGLPLPDNTAIQECFYLASEAHRVFIPEMRPDPTKTTSIPEQVHNAKTRLDQLRELFVPRYRQLLASEMGKKIRE